MFDHARRSDIADILAVALATSVPLSTSATSILAVCWLVAVLGIIDWKALKAELLRPVCWSPLVLLALGALGMAWADVPMAERFKGLDSFLKLAAIPLLIFQFRSSPRGYWVLGGYLAACVLALLVQLVIVAQPDIYWREKDNFPAPFKSPATQSGEFLACTAVLAFMAIDFYRRGRTRLAMVCVVLCAGFVAAPAFFATARTPWIVAPVLLIVLALREFSYRGAALFLAVCAVLAGVLFYSSPYFRTRMTDLPKEVHSYIDKGTINSSGERLEFWTKANDSIKQAPLLGHGTGTIYQQMQMRSNDAGRPYPSATPNPHQQTLAVAMQLGIVGAVLLWAMWIAHFSAVMRAGLAAWIGIVVVLQNIVGSLFNSHLFDFTQGWTYVVGVGVVIGMLRHDATRAKSPASP
jgi:hypothetical protein